MRVLSVPSSVPFLRTVVAALIDGRLIEGFEARTQPERLTQATLYLPTRRARRLVRAIFLDGLVPDGLDEYWQYSLDFLRIARKAWPAYLSEIGKMEPATRRDRLIDAEARRLAAHHAGPVIAAGSTGSMPATAKFLHVIAQL